MTEITHLWIAEEFVKAEGSLTVEETAEEYYRELIMRNLLQPVFKEFDRYQMHDILHCLAQYLARDESLVVGKVHEVGSSNGPMKLRRVFVRDKETTEIPDVFVKQNSLRTLIWRYYPMSEMDVVFNKLSLLRVLDISRSKIQRLPDSLGNLVHLRYLNISSTEISMIPEGIGNLRNLQFLDISWTQISVIPETIGNLRNLQFLKGWSCWSLSRLPNSIVNLHNLRSLDLVDTVLVGMPAGLRRLQNLHTLRGFRLQRNRSEVWCTMEELRSLSCLTDLSIDALECISSSSQAKAAQLGNKSKLRSLQLSCTPGLQPSEEEMRRIEEVFEELHPPSCLEVLRIKGYFGREFPKWMADISSSTPILFPNLWRLALHNCNCFERFPSWGLHPNLEVLSVRGFGASVIDVTSSSSSGCSRARVEVFPKLKTLEFCNMPNWQEWRWDKGTQAMPCLINLTLLQCPKLMSLPEGLGLHATSLTLLNIFDADSLTTIENLLSLKYLYLVGNPNLEKVSDLPALTTLKVEHCPKLQVVDLPSLKRMELIDYEMKSLPSYLPKGVQRGSKKRKRGHRPTKTMKGIHTSHLEELEIECNMGLMRKICRKASPEWPTIQDIQQVRVYSKDKSVYAFYNKSSGFTTNFYDTSSSSSSE